MLNCAGGAREFPVGRFHAPQASVQSARAASQRRRSVIEPPFHLGTGGSWCFRAGLWSPLTMRSAWKTWRKRFAVVTGGCLTMRNARHFQGNMHDKKRGGGGHSKSNG